VKKYNVFIQSGGGRRPFEATATVAPAINRENGGANSCPADQINSGTDGDGPY